MHILKYILKQGAIATAVYVLLAYALSWVIPDGVNQAFLASIWKWGVPLTGVLLLGWWLCRATTNIPCGTSAKQSFLDTLLMPLLPMTPVVQYVYNNQNILDAQESLIVLAAAAMVAILGVIILPLLLARIVDRRVTLAIGLALVFVCFNMPIFSLEFAWYGRGDNLVLAAISAGLAAVFILLALFQQRILSIGVVVYFVTNSALGFMYAEQGIDSTSDKRSATRAGPSEIVQLAEQSTPQHKPNIYVLTYDSYVPNEVMKNYGIDNSDQEDRLRSMGFTIYPRVYTVGGDTRTSMGSVFNQANYAGAVGGRNDVVQVLKSLEYTTYSVFKTGYVYQENGAHYDHHFPDLDRASLTILYAMLEGQFRFDVTFNKVSLEDFVLAKRSVLSNSATPKFVFSLTGPSHSQNSGVCLKNEVELFANRLESANQEMLADLELLVADPNAVIIVNGDHGPYLTKNCTKLDSSRFPAGEIQREDIQDRFASFLAIRWPAEASTSNVRMDILQDIFPNVFAYIFGEERFRDIRLPPVILDKETSRIGGVTVDHGIIKGGAADGETLFSEMQ